MVIGIYGPIHLTQVNSSFLETFSFLLLSLLQLLLISFNHYCYLHMLVLLSPEGTPQQRVPLRAMISGASNLLALPIVIASFYLKLPSCFLIFIASGIVSVSALWCFFWSPQLTLIKFYCVCFIAVGRSIFESDPRSHHREVLHTSPPYHPFRCPLRSHHHGHRRQRHSARTSPPVHD